MSYTVRSDFSLVRDAAQLLSWKASGSKSFCFSSASEVRGDAQWAEAVRILRETVGMAFERLSLTEEELSLFSPDLPEDREELPGSSCLAAPFLSGCMLGYDEVVRTVQAAGEDMMRAFLISYMCPDEGAAEVPDTWKNRDARVFTRSILSDDALNSEQKCHILSVYTDYAALFRRAADVLARCMDVLSSLAPRLAPLVDHYMQAMEQPQPGECPALLERLISHTAITSALCFPCLSMPKGICIQIRRRDGTPTAALFPEDNTYIYVGLYVPYTPQTHPFEEAITAQEVPALLKVLSDKSKFDILSSLSGHSYYAAQLAQRLSLSPATISHHMSMLLDTGLIHFEEKENKVYYTQNAQRVRALLHAAQGALLKDAQED